MYAEKTLQDALFLIICSILVFFMQPGFMCLESGLTRQKNSINVAAKNLMDFTFSFLIFWALGFGLMFGSSYSGFIGVDLFFSASSEGGLHEAFFLFEAMFCATAVTIFSGAVAERMRFSAYMIVAVFLALFIYPVFGHWVWNGIDQGTATGWLGRLGFTDFAGGTVVHSLGGWAALAIVLILGPRKGRFAQGVSIDSFNPANLPMAVLGTLLIWFSWFGFNAGSTLVMNHQVVIVVINTAIAGCAGGVTAMLLGWYWYKIPRVSFLVLGSLAGLVSITACCNYITPIQSFAIGSIGAFICLAVDHLLVRCKIDDAVGAVPVHLGCGIWSSIAVALFGSPSLLNTGLSFAQQLGIQLLGIFVCFLIAFVIPYMVIKTIDKFFKLRVSEQEELDGLNVSEHGARTDLQDLLSVMEEQALTHNLNLRAPETPYTDVGRIAHRYNQVMDVLQNSIEKLDAIFTCAADAIVVFLPKDYRILTANDSAIALFGDRSIATDGKSMNHYLAKPLPEFTQEALSSKKAIELTGLRDEKSIPLEVTVAYSESTGQSFYVGIFRDISERKQLDQLRYQKALAEESNKAKSEFLANMSHEIRTPMNGVLGMTEVLQQTSLNKHQEELLSIIKTSGHSLMGIINDILDFSKIEAGKLELEQSNFDLRSCLKGVTDIISFLAESKGIVCHCKFQSDIPILVKGDSGRLRQVLLNLASNAVKFTQEGEVLISVSAQNISDSHVDYEITVKDTGIGIAEEQLQQLFEPFSQADSSITRRFGGTGLGLSISKQIIELMGGKISAQSEDGKGSVFTISLSLAKQASLNKTSSVSGDDPQLTSNLEKQKDQFRILVVDDSLLNRQVMLEMLRLLGYKAHLAVNGLKAMELMQKAPYDLVFMDLQMPEIDGFEATKIIRKNEQHEGKQFPTTIIALTADARADCQKQCIEQGFDAYLSKPITKDILMQTLEIYRCRKMDKHSSIGNNTKETL
ncbi:MAG: ammonium transporter [Planctomycetes bacterium]|nr:ammonium transporter [Planctomycetota bacterium]